MLNRNKVWIGMGGAGVVVVVLVATAALLWGGGASPSSDTETQASTSAASANTDAQRGGPVPVVMAEQGEQATPEVKSIITPPGDEAAPDFQGIVGWINSPPLALQDLRGKVVLVDFWTYSCIPPQAGQRTIPYVRDWHSKYASPPEAGGRWRTLAGVFLREG